jgi:CBS domain containing-hemolysin-like protein
MGSLPIFTLEQFFGIDVDAQDVRTVGGLILQTGNDAQAGERIEFEWFDVVVGGMEVRE